MGSRHFWVDGTDAYLAACDAAQADQELAEQRAIMADTYSDHRFEVGQQVIWRGGWGSRAPIPAKIVDKGEKNGEVVYDLDNGHWAYEYQLKGVQDVDSI